MQKTLVVTVSKPALFALALAVCVGTWTRQPIAQQPGGLLATDLVLFSRTGSCPTGWVEDTTLRGLSLVGLPLSGSNLAVVGTALTNTENRSVGQHTHVQDAHGHGVTDNGHQHTQRFGQRATDTGITTNGFNDISTFDGVLTASATTGVTVNTGTATNQNTGAVVGTNAPFIQYIACKKT